MGICIFVKFRVAAVRAGRRIFGRVISYSSRAGTSMSFRFFRRDPGHIFRIKNHRTNTFTRQSDLNARCTRSSRAAAP